MLHIVRAIIMALEEEMRNEMIKLEKEIAVIDEEIERLHLRLVNLINIRKKKEYNLKALRENFGIYSDMTDRYIQTTLSRMLKESM